MYKSLVVAILCFISVTSYSAEGSFSFAGHVTLKNDVPVQIQITMFEGDFTQAPADEDTAALKQALTKDGSTLESEIFYSMKNEKPNMLIMLLKKDATTSIFILDLEGSQKYLYNVSELESKRIISRKEGYSDYILEVK